VKNLSTGELILYAGASLLYWWLAYVAIKLASILRCGLGPGSPNDCTAGTFPYGIAVGAAALYVLLVWLTLRDAE
jgi:hypothetical protein